MGDGAGARDEAVGGFALGESLDGLDEVRFERVAARLGRLLPAEKGAEASDVFAQPAERLQRLLVRGAVGRVEHEEGCHLVEGRGRSVVGSWKAVEGSRYSREVGRHLGKRPREHLERIAGALQLAEQLSAQVPELLQVGEDAEALLRRQLRDAVRSNAKQ